jgi:hypothetical protein
MWKDEVEVVGIQGEVSPEPLFNKCETACDPVQ